MQEIRELVGAEVEVFANGMVYRGTLIEVSDTEVHLKGSLGYVSLPASSVGEIRRVERSAPPWAATFDVPVEEKKEDTIP